MVRQSSENSSPACPKIAPTVAEMDSYVMLAPLGEATLAGQSGENLVALMLVSPVNGFGAAKRRGPSGGSA